MQIARLALFEVNEKNVRALCCNETVRELMRIIPERLDYTWFLG
jgi:hypothetical protein